MILSEILNNVSSIQVLGEAEKKDIESIHIDSRDVSSNSIFIAIRGFKSDGHEFVIQAINNGAEAVVLDDDSKIPDDIFIKSKSVKILVEDSRLALPEISHAFYGQPSKKLNVIGVTGTKGKTTTTYFLKKIFEDANQKVGLIGTNKNIIAGKEFATKLTTPQSNTINQLMSLMIQEDCSNCIMEVSSHALDLHRVDLIDFDTAVFTNITSDHMDYHKSFENYLKAKKILFDNLKRNALVVYNYDDVNSNELLKDCDAAKYSYGFNDLSDFKLSNLNYSLDGTVFDLTFEKQTITLKTCLVGGFNAYNAAASFAAASLNGIDWESIKKSIEMTPQIPGRFEILSGKNKKVIIDYSHTTDSLRQALTALGEIVGGERKIYTVFGCGGDRDKTKRPKMGKTAYELSDYTFVTSDNPRTENPESIIRDILLGMGSENVYINSNRDEAIKEAIVNSTEDAVILVAGKGHENYQEINGVRNHFSDKEVAEKYLGAI